MKGQLILVPTPIDDTSELEPTAKSMLLQAVDNQDIICVEELKEGRRRWIRFGLPREAIENFIHYNEHTREDLLSDLLQKMQSGKNIFMMSDCGLPAFCDPGQKLVNLCHESKIKVTSTPFPNSIALAISLSGFSHERFVFEGFIPAKSAERSKELKRILKSQQMSIIMDTPYRLKKLIDEMAEINPNRIVFLGLELNKEGETLLRTSLGNLAQKIQKDKKEFILIVGPGK